MVENFWKLLAQKAAEAESISGLKMEDIHLQATGP